MKMQDSSHLRSPHWRQKVERRSNYSAGWQYISHHWVLLYPAGTLRKRGQKKAPCMPTCMPNRSNTKHTQLIRASYCPVQTTPGHQIRMRKPQFERTGAFLWARFIASAMPPTAPAGLPGESACATPAAFHPPLLFDPTLATAQSPATPPPAKATPPELACSVSPQAHRPASRRFQLAPAHFRPWERRPCGPSGRGRKTLAAPGVRLLRGVRRRSLWISPVAARGSA